MKRLYQIAEWGYYQFWKVIAFLFFGLPVIGGIMTKKWFWKEKGALILVYHKLSGQAFEKHISFIRRNWQILPLDDITSLMRQGESLPISVVITFDDGYKSNYTDVFPILKKYGIPMTLYLVSGMIGTEKEFWWQSLTNLRAKGIEVPSHGYLKSIPEEQRIQEMNDLFARHQYTPRSASNLSWDEVKEMVASGLVNIGSHTRDHLCLTLTSPENATNEIANSKKELESALSIKVDHFSYPNGDYSSYHVSVCKQVGYLTATTAMPGVNTAKTNPYELRRILIRPDETLPGLALKITGLGHRLGQDYFTMKHLEERKGLLGQPRRHSE